MSKQSGAEIEEPELEPTPQSELEKAYDVTDPSEKPVETPEPEEKIDGEETPAVEGGEENTAAEEGEDIDEALLQKALSLGFTEEEVQEMGSNAKLQRFVDLATPKEPAKVAETKAPAAEAPKVEPDFKIDLDPKDYDEKVVKVLNDLNAHYAKKHADLAADFQKKLDAGFAPVKQYQQEQFFLTVNQAFDTIATEQPEVKALIGTGAVNGTAQGKMRQKIYDQAVIIEGGYIQQGKTPPPIKTMLTQAAQIVLAPQLKTLATNKVRSAVAERRTQFVARGTPSRLSGDPGKSGEERARTAVEAFLKSKGE